MHVFGSAHRAAELNIAVVLSLLRFPSPGPSAAAALAAVTLAVGACSSGNGDRDHGPTVGPLPLRDGGRSDGGEDDDGGLEDGGRPDGEAGAPGCASGTVALVAGDDGSLGGAVQVRGGAWTVASIAGGAARSKPALVPYGAGFLAVVHGAGDALQTTTYGASWSAPATFGTANVKGAPSLAVLGPNAHLVYSAGPNANRDYFHGIHDGNAWNAATAKVGPGPFSFGTVSAGLAARDNQLVFAENGRDNGMYVSTFNDGAWSGGMGVNGIGTIGANPPATPELVALEGKYDLALIFSWKDEQPEPKRISSALHVRGTDIKDWKVLRQIHPDAVTEEKLAVTAIAGGRLVVTYRPAGSTTSVYSIGTIKEDDTIAWTAPVAFGGAAPIKADSTAAVAPGVCGDAAIAAYASENAIFVTRLRGGTWTAPEPLPALVGRRVAISTR